MFVLNIDDLPPSETVSTSAANPLGSLRRFIRPRKSHERCELCAAEIGEQHQHLFAPADRQIACACGACAILFSGRAGRYRLVPQRAEFWPDFRVTDEQWQALNIPINLAFFTPSSVANRVVAYYPSPAGATESLLPVEAWAELLEANPRLAQLQPDVEALLVNRVGESRQYYRAPIDACYRLVGLIRANWRGLSGGVDVWRAIAEFFAEMQKHSR